MAKHLSDVRVLLPPSLDMIMVSIQIPTFRESQEA